MSDEEEDRESQESSHRRPVIVDTTTSSAINPQSVGASPMMLASGLGPFQSGSSGTFPFPLVTPSGQVFLTVPFPTAVPYSLPQGLSLPTINPNSVVFPYGQFFPSPVVSAPGRCASPSQPATTTKHHYSLSSQGSSETREVADSPASSISTPRQPAFQSSEGDTYGRAEVVQSLQGKTLPVMTSSTNLDQQGEQKSVLAMPPKQMSSASPFISKLLAQKSQDAGSASGMRSTASLKKLLAAQPLPLQDPMLEELKDEPDLLRFYKCFKASPQASHLHIELLPTEGNGTLKWLQVRQKLFHIDPELGPVTIARILLSSNGLLRFQLLFPVYKAIYAKLFIESEVEKVLAELSPHHVLCPGLLGYKDKYTVLGYHPSHVRVLETTYVKRYDHEHCPIWHIPSMTYSKGDQNLQKMCKQCRVLQNSIVRLATKACEIDPAERESWTDPSSNRPLAYMSAADREERYRKLRQERTQLLVKLRMYEERLGIGKNSIFG